MPPEELIAIWIVNLAKELEASKDEQESTLIKNYYAPHITRLLQEGSKDSKELILTLIKALDICVKSNGIRDGDFLTHCTINRLAYPRSIKTIDMTLKLNNNLKYLRLFNAGCTTEKMKLNFVPSLSLEEIARSILMN